ncbi:MAG TPA: adenylate/guanylate cyclase domain-containing protein [Gaiellaceae bacterium]|nr:adenylate/guanylate cyclase domain-containing protein [Gaiellaceae bacterium]
MSACPNCGRVNAESARFCSDCGARLPGAAAREVRKTVTVLFADVTGSTALGERLDPESFRRVMARYFDAARECLERHGGTVEKFIGDAVMAAFGVPVVHEDDALRALRAAVDLRRSLESLNGELEPAFGVTLQLRTGVNTGEVVTGTEERLVTGDAVNVAARLEQAAGPGEILVGPETYRLARGAIEAEEIQPLALKGKTAPFAAYRLVSVVEGAPSFVRRLDAPLVGRRDELARVRSAFDDAVSLRRCRRVTVLGPPGIGKSRLAREVSTALDSKASVLSGRCLPYGEGITYWPLVEIFRAAAAEDELEAALAAGAPEEVFWLVRKALERRARERPLALVFEDIHWAEPTFLDLADHLEDWTRDAPVLLLCLARPELLDERPGWSGEVMTLEPLSEVESEELIENLLGGAPLDDHARGRIREVAEGNPLYVEQLLAMLAEGGDPGHVPPTIHALLGARLDSLPEDDRDLLERASVIGHDFEWEALGELSSDRRRPSGARLAALVRNELIRPHDVIEDTFSFRHALIRDAAYSRLPKELRSELHERFAGWLDGRGEEFEEIVGYHLEQAYRWVVELGPPDERARCLAERAAEHLVSSGSRARARGDGPAAANLFDRAVALLPPYDSRRIALLPVLGRALRDAARMEQAESVLAEAVERAEATGARVIAADASLALVELRFHGNAATRQEVLEEVADATRIFGEHGDEAGLARALLLGGQLLFWGGEMAEALGYLERAARHARNAGDRHQEAECHQYVLAVTVFGFTPVADALARVEGVRSLVEGNRKLDVAVLNTRARLDAMEGRFDDARAAIARAAERAEGGREVERFSHVSTAAGMVELLAGDAAAAERELRPACERLEQIGELGYLASAVPPLLEALYRQGRDDEALLLSERWRPELLTVPEDVDAQVGWRAVRAKLLARRGDVSEAETLAREATKLAAGTDDLELRARAITDLAEVLRIAGRAHEAAAALEEALRFHEQKGNLISAARARTLLSQLSVGA